MARREGKTVELPALFAPKSIEIVQDLPLNPSGKVDKKQPRQRYWGSQDRQVH